MIIYLTIAIIIVLVFILLLVGNTKNEERPFVFILASVLSICSICLGGIIEKLRIETSIIDSVENVDKKVYTDKEIVIEKSKGTLFIYIEKDSNNK